MSGGPATKHVKHEEEYMPSTAAIQAAQDSIAAFMANIAKLEKKLEAAEEKAKKWDERVEKAFDEGKPGAELAVYIEQQKLAQAAVENAQAALLEEKKLLLEKEKLLLAEKKLLLDNAQQRQLEKEELAAAVANPVPIVEVVNQELAEVAWPLQNDVRLLPPAYAEGNIHASKHPDFAVATPNKPDRPAMLFYRLGEKKFVSGQPLTQFNAVNDRQKCTVLLAPSGAGKTRKLFELLYEKLGYFIPYKLNGDKNEGSTALSTIVTMLEQDSTIDWKNENPAPLDYETRHARAHFAIYCVLIAFTEVYLELKRRFEDPPTPFQWLLIQLFPTYFFKADVFEILAKRLYQCCDQQEVLNYSSFLTDLYCVIDEAQMLTNTLTNKFRTTRPGARNSLGRRPVLSPILQGVKQTLNRLPTIAGTGLTLLEEWKSVVSAMGVEQDFVFTDFPLLDNAQVLNLLKKFLVVENEPAKHAANWLVGRPRWAAEFISNAIAHNKPTDLYFDERLKLLTGVDDGSAQPRTLFGAFQRMTNKPGRSLLAGEQIQNPQEAFLQDAFLLSMGATPSPRESPLLLEFGLGFSVAGFEHKTIVQFEPLVLETARLLIKDDSKFRLEFLRSVSEDPSALGKRFEYVSATTLLKSFTSQVLEEHPLLKGTTLPEAFKGHWKSKDAMYLYGKLATTVTEMKGFYQHHNEPILFPDQFAGPDTVLTLTKPNSKDVLTIFIQDKVKKSLGVDGAKLTVNPAKLHHDKRGQVDEVAKHGVDSQRTTYLKKLSGPVIRVVVSVLAGFGTEQRVQLVPGQHGSQDLLLLIDSSNARPVYGKDLWEYIRELKGVFDD